MKDYFSPTFKGTYKPQVMKLPYENFILFKQ